MEECFIYWVGGHEKPRGNTLFPSILHEEKYRMIFFWRKTSAKVSWSRLNTFWIDFQMQQTITNQLATQGSSGYTTLAYPDQTVGRRNSLGWTHWPFLLRRTEGGAFSAHWSQTRELRPDFKNPPDKRSQGITCPSLEPSAPLDQELSPGQGNAVMV